MKRIVLYDKNESLCNEWKKQFKNYPNVEIRKCNFEELEYERVVTAGNSFGWMTGGIDLAVRNYYGIQLQDEIQKIILSEFQHELPVGESIIIDTFDLKKRYLIYVPTMRYPMKISEIDVFYVFAKLLEKYDDFACCGLGTGTGGISEEECAKQMRMAYEYVLNLEK